MFQLQALQRKISLATKLTFFNLSTAAFSFFSHFLLERCICFETMRRLISSSSSDIEFPMATVLAALLSCFAL
jgi:hypothetical protein